MRRKAIALLFHATDAPLGLLAIVIKKLVLRLTLAKSHPLHVGHEQLDEVVGGNAVEEALGAVVVHLHDAHEGKMVQGLGPCVVVGSQFEGFFGIDSRGIERAVVVGVGQVVQPVNGIAVARRTGRKTERAQQQGEASSEKPNEGLKSPLISRFHDRKDRELFSKTQIFGQISAAIPEFLLFLQANHQSKTKNYEIRRKKRK